MPVISRDIVCCQPRLLNTPMNGTVLPAGGAILPRCTMVIHSGAFTLCQAWEGPVIVPGVHRSDEKTRNGDKEQMKDPA